MRRTHLKLVVRMFEQIRDGYLRLDDLLLTRIVPDNVAVTRLAHLVVGSTLPTLDPACDGRVVVDV